MNETQDKIRIGKLEAARRQLETAITLYFAYGDPISIHTLVGAAYGLIHGINEKRGGTMMVKDAWKFLNPENAKTFKKGINSVENFLKHADWDPPDATLDLNPQWTEALLCEASQRYYVLTEEQPQLLQLFVLWYALRHPDMFCGTPEGEILRKVPPDTLPADRREFFNEFFSHLAA